MSVRLSSEGSRRVAALALAAASLLASAAVGSVFLSTALDAWIAAAAPGPAGPADGILLVTGLGGSILSVWLGLGMTLSALSALPGAMGRSCRRLAGRVAPTAVRKAVAFVLGTTLTAALVPGTALGDTTGIGHGAHRPTVIATQHGTSDDKHPLAAPEASFSSAGRQPPAMDGDVGQVTDDHAHGALFAPDAAPRPSWSLDRTGRPGGRVVVLRGDTLWSIAARHLGPAATAAEIDAEWNRWHVTNRDVIGDEPNLILPGQLLRPPPSPQAGS